MGKKRSQNKVLNFLDTLHDQRKDKSYQPPPPPLGNKGEEKISETD